MMTIMSVVLLFCLSALVPTYGTPLAQTFKVPYKVIHLQKPEPDVVARATRTTNPQHLFRATPVQAASRTLHSFAPRIVQGTDAEEGQFPHQVAVFIDTSSSVYFCGGSIIDPCWILTAAHCLPQGVASVTVMAGTTKWKEATIERSVIAAYVHSDYDSSRLSNDIALFKLESALPIIEGFVEPIELETEGCQSDLLSGELAVVSGWGSIRDFAIAPHDDLLWAETLTISNAACQSFYGDIVSDSNICSVSSAGYDGVVCNGDSGGALLWKETGRQIGVVSFISSSGCQVDMPNGYTRVPCYYNWIQTVKRLSPSCT